MFILSSITSGLELRSVNHISIYENSELNIYKNIKFVREISKTWPNNWLGTNVQKTLESCWLSLLTILQSTNTTLAISKWDTFSPLLPLVMLLLVLQSNFIISEVKSYS